MPLNTNTAVFMPPLWNICFAVLNIYEAVTEVQSLDGNAAVPALDVPNFGRFAGLTDPRRAFCFAPEDA